MPSYPRISLIPNIYIAPQTFDNFIVINGIKCRPRHVTEGNQLVIMWEQEVNGVWKSVADKTNP